MKYQCLVLDHDETVVQSEKTIGYPCFCETLSKLRPDRILTLQEYVRGCHELGFVEMCKQWFHFTESEMQQEYNDWMDYVEIHVPEPFPGIEQIIRKQKAEGGLVCVVSHSSARNISRDYQVHFGLQPDKIYSCDDPKDHQKPHAYPLLDIMNRYQLKPEELLVVDDMKLACQMAKPVNVPVAFAAWGKTEFPEIAEEMRQLCDFSFDTTQDLMNFLYDDFAV